MGPICWLLIFQLLATGTNDKRCGRAAAQVQETGVNENAGKNWETGRPEMGRRAGDGGGKSNGKFAVVEIVNKGGSRFAAFHRTTVWEKDKLPPNTKRPDKGIPSASRETNASTFLEVPEARSLRTEHLQLDGGYFVFEELSYLMGLLQPDNFPAELLRTLYVRKGISTYIVGFQFLKLEAFSVLWFLFWTLLCLCLPVSIAVQLCCRPSSKTITTPGDNSLNSAETRTVRWWTAFIAHILLILLVANTALMLLANQQFNNSTSNVRSVFSASFEDIKTFIEDTQDRINSITTTTKETSLNTIRSELDRRGEVIGRSYQNRLVEETHVDEALEALNDLRDSVWKVGSLTSELLKQCRVARKLGKALQEELKELAVQLSSIKRQCLPKDISLCDTLQTRTFQLAFDVDNIAEENKLQILEQIVKDDLFNKSIDKATSSFECIPKMVDAQTENIKSDISVILGEYEMKLNRSLLDAQENSKNLTKFVYIVKEKLEKLLVQVLPFEFYRWLVVAGTAGSVVLVWMSYICGIPCGCPNTPKTVSALMFGLIFSCLVCVILCLTGNISFFIGSHGKAFVCNAIQDNISTCLTIRDIINDKNVTNKDNGSRSCFSQILTRCYRNESIFAILNRSMVVFPINELNFNQTLNTIMFGNDVAILTPMLQSHLLDLSAGLDINLTQIRTNILEPLTSGDLASFAEQLNVIPRKVDHPPTAKELEFLSMRTKKVISDYIKPLQNYRNSIMYTATKLEILGIPSNEGLIKIMSHLKMVQNTIDSRGNVLAKSAVVKFHKHLEHQIKMFKTQVSNEINKNTGRCEPLWKIFNVLHHQLCSLMLSSVNSIAFSSYFNIALLLIIAHCVIQIIINHWESTSSTTTPSLEFEDRIWASPPSIICPAYSPDLTTFDSPRPSSVENLIPLPPRPPSELLRSVSPNSRIKEWRARTPRGRFQSLRLVQPLVWKSSLSPRNWI